MITKFNLYEYFDTMTKNDYFKDRSDCCTFGASLMPEWEESLTEEEINAIEWFRDGGFMDAAQYLVTGKGFMVYDEISDQRKNIKTFVNTILKSLDNAKLPEDVITYKGIRRYNRKSNLNNTLMPEIEKLKENDTYQFKTLISSTLHYKYAINAFSNFGDNDIEILKFKLHKGDHAAYVSLAHPEDGSRTENEILISPKTKFKITNIFKTETNLGGKNRIVNVTEFTSI